MIPIGCMFNDNDGAGLSDSQRNHNRVVKLYNDDEPITRNERAILALVDGFRQTLNHGSAHEPLFAKHVTYHLYVATMDLLAHDRGRIDAGKISGFMVNAAKYKNCNVSTGEFEEFSP